jgi:nicotinate-nucleotide adenylyltransferase
MQPFPFDKRAQVPPAPGEDVSAGRIGLIGGSFDPVHFGHLRVAEEIGERFDLQIVEFIPCMIPPHKPASSITVPRHRIAMLRRALSGNSRFRLSEKEIKRGGVSYLYDTLAEYRKDLGAGAHLFFIMGMDSFLEIATWHRYEDLFGMAHFIVAARPGYRRPALAEILPARVARTFKRARDPGDRIQHESGTWVYFEKVSFLEISATDIRTRIASGRSVRYLLPEPVRTYIERHHLYRNDPREEQLARA